MLILYCTSEQLPPILIAPLPPLKSPTRSAPKIRLDIRAFLRVSLGLRYGLTRTWEIGAGTDAYFAHGISDAKFFERYGIANLQFGSKWNLGNRILKSWDSAVGFEAVSPVDHPPAEMTDGLRHAVPFISFSRRLVSRRDVRVFWSVGFDKVGHTDIPGEFKKNDLADSSNFVTVGAVMDRGRLHYTLESTAATTRLLGDTHCDSITLRPGVLREIPSRKGGGEKSNWVLGAALKAAHGPDGMSYGASLKLRLNFDIKRLLGRQGRPFPRPDRQEDRGQGK